MYSFVQTMIILYLAKIQIKKDTLCDFFNGLQRDQLILQTMINNHLNLHGRPLGSCEIWPDQGRASVTENCVKTRNILVGQLLQFSQKRSLEYG
jgi:hypothetical protein